MTKREAMIEAIRNIVENQSRIEEFLMQINYTSEEYDATLEASKILFETLERRLRVAEREEGFE